MASSAVHSDNVVEKGSHAILDAVQHLPAECHAAFILKVFQGLSYREIAIRLDISTESVERYVAHGLLNVHRFLKRRCGVQMNDKRVCESNLS